MVAVQALDAKTAGSSKEPLGRVVINLADFASDDGRATQAFTVACSRSISAAVGEAKLLVTIGYAPPSLFCMLYSRQHVHTCVFWDPVGSQTIPFCPL